MDFKLTEESIFKMLDEKEVVFLARNKGGESELVLMKAHTFQMYKDIIESLIDPTVSLERVRNLVIDVKEIVTH